MLKSAVQMYVGHQMLSTTGMELCVLTISFEFWLRIVEKMGLIPLHMVHSPPSYAAGVHGAGIIDPS